MRFPTCPYKKTWQKKEPGGRRTRVQAGFFPRTQVPFFSFFFPFFLLFFLCSLSFFRFLSYQRESISPFLLLNASTMLSMPSNTR